MANVTLEKVSLDVKITLNVNEREAKALDALVGYGGADFVKIFQEKLGKSYLSGYEKDLIDLFESIRTQIPSALEKVSEVRKKLQS